MVGDLWWTADFLSPYLDQRPFHLCQVQRTAYRATFTWHFQTLILAACHTFLCYIATFVCCQFLAASEIFLQKHATFQILTSFWFPPAQFCAVWHEGELNPTGAPAMGIDCILETMPETNAIMQLGRRIFLGLQEVQASVLCIFLFTSHMPMSLANLARVRSGFFWAILRKPRRPQTLLCLRLGHRKLNVYICHMLRTPWAAKPSFQQGPLINDQRLFRGPVTCPFPIIVFICAKQTRCQAGTGWREDLGASKHLPPLAPGIACRATQKLSAPQLFCIGPCHSLPCHASCKVWKPLYKYHSTRLIDCMSNLFRCSKVATLLSATLLWPKVSCPPHVDQHEHPWPPCASKKLHRSRAAAEAFLYEACASHLFERETCRPRVQKSGTQNALLQKAYGAKVFPGKQFITSPDLPRQPGTAWLISGKLPSVYSWRKKLTLKLKITSPFVPSSLGNKPFPRKHFEPFPRKRSRSNVFFDFEGRCSLFAPRRPSNILLCITTSLAPAQRDKGCRI